MPADIHCIRHASARLAILLVALGLLLGCSSGNEKTAPAESSQPVAETPPPPPPPPPPTAPGSQAASASPAPAQPEPVRQKAEVGVGEKGHGYGTGPIATPAATLFRVKERIAFDIQIPQAMNLFKASEGRPPKSHDEFMSKIIKANQIHLPTLPEGQRYLYDPKQEQLMVEQSGQ
jgi:hypothetical protein